MQQVFDVLISEGIGKRETQKLEEYQKNMNKITQREKEDFVKQNWNKSKNSASIMLALSKIDPATMSSELNDDGNEHKPSLGWGKKDNNNNETDW